MSSWTDKRDAALEWVKERFESLESRIEALLSKGAAAIASAISANAGNIEGDVVDFLETSAKNAVAEAEASTGVTGQGKMEIALGAFGTALATQGLQLAENEARILLENALADFKAS